jgi:hypothetical protein
VDIANPKGRIPQHTLPVFKHSLIVRLRYASQYIFIGAWVTTIDRDNDGVENLSIRLNQKSDHV